MFKNGRYYVPWNEMTSNIPHEGCVNNRSLKTFEYTIFYHYDYYCAPIFR